MQQQNNICSYPPNQILDLVFPRNSTIDFNLPKYTIFELSFPQSSNVNIEVPNRSTLVIRSSSFQHTTPGFSTIVIHLL